MKKILSSFLLMFSIVFLSACASKESITIKIYKNAKVNLSAYKTYQWLVGTNILVDDKKEWRTRAYNINQFVEYHIATQLMDKDIYKTQVRPDFLISYVVGVNMDAISEKVDKNGEKYFKNVPEAGFAIVFLDPQTKKVIWASQAETILKPELSDEESQKRISDTIEQMFTQF